MWALALALGRGQKPKPLSRMKENYSCKDELIACPSRRKTMKKGIQYLRELLVLEEVCRDSNNEQSTVDPDQIQLTQYMWPKFIWSAPLSYTKSLTLMSMKEGEETVFQRIT